MLLTRAQGPLVLSQGGARARVDELTPVRTDRGVTLRSGDGRVRVDLVEHLFAAIGGLGIVGGLCVEVRGDELPLLDGGALRYVEALHELDLPRGLRSRVTREAVIAHERSMYRFAPGRCPELRVEIDFPPPIGRGSAAWEGDPGDFAARIAPARTFGSVCELDALRASGRAAGVDLGSVLVFDERGPLPGCRPPGPEEPARHKLLDLIGDLVLYGGPPLGVIEAVRPGHTATHVIAARAREIGVLETEGGR